MRTKPLMTTREIPKLRAVAIILASVLVGLTLARFMRISPQAAIVVLSSGIALSITILMRRIDYLLIGWIVLTTFIMIIMNRLMPEYYGFVGRGIFWGLLACIIVAWALDNIFRRTRFIRFDNVPLKVAIVIFLLWGSLSLFVSLDLFNSVKHLTKFVIALVASYMFYNFFSQDERNIRTFIKIITFLAVAVSFATVASGFESLISGVPLYKRISLWFWNPNSLGTFLFLSLPIVITAGFHFLKNKAVRVLLTGVLLLGLFLSFHRTSWVAATASILYLLCRTRIRIPVLFAMVAGLFLAGLLLPSFGEDFYFYVTGARYTGRKEIWAGAWNAACDHPVLGVGVGNSLMVTPDYMYTPSLKNEDAHNVYLNNAVEMGFASAVILLAIYLILIRSSWKTEESLRPGYLRSVTRGITATFIGLLFHGIFENGFFLTEFGAAEFTVIMPYVLMGLPFACKRLDERSLPTS